MADRGIKMAKDGETINSTNPEDYHFWTKYPPLAFLEKKTVVIVATSGDCEGTEPVPYDYDFIPLVFGSVAKTAGSPTGQNGDRFLMPAADFAGINCDDDSGEIPNLGFNYEVREGFVDINYVAECIIPMSGTTCPLTNATFTVELYFYMWELGSEWPLP